MVTRQQASKVRRPRNRPSKAPGNRDDGSRRNISPEEPIYGVPVPERLHEAIEIERDNLSKAESVLACMVLAMEHETVPFRGPYYPALAQIAREFVERSINGLDSFVLSQRLRRDKVEEVFSIRCIEHAYPLAL